MDLLLAHQTWLRVSIFLVILTTMFLLELIIPKRSWRTKKSLRWWHNMSLVVLNSLLLRILFPFAAIGVALWAEQQHWGLLNYLQWPTYITIPLGAILLDGAIYIQHVNFHALPLLWRFHKIHHFDMDFDVTTGLRFHPVEMILSMLIKFAVIILIGAPAGAVVLFEILLNASSMFNHSNINLPLALDKLLRYFIVTPDMHRVHHSDINQETNSNYGFCLSIWDKIFGTYIDQPQKGHQKMTIGLKDYRDPEQTQKILPILMTPFKK